MLWWVAAGFVAASIASAIVTTVIVSNIYGQQLAAEGLSVSPQIKVQTGQDPVDTACIDDAKVATASTRTDNSLLEIIWSNKCQAGWGRITRYDGLEKGNTVTIAIYPETAPNGPDRQEATEHDVQGAYTNLVVRPSKQTLLCTVGSYTVNGKRVVLGDPLCI